MQSSGQPVTRRIRANGIKLTYYEWRAKPGNHQSPLLIAHATGFHGRCYSAIAEHFPDRRVLSLDLRGHGQSEGDPVDNWRLISDDVLAFLEQLNIRRAVGVGHSMGAHILLQCASDRSEAFDQLILFDPVILAPEFYGDSGAQRALDAPHPTIRRKRDFASPEAMMERFAPRDPYRLFEPRVFEDYCRFGLKESAVGGFELACSPEMESSVYSSSRSNHTILKSARDLEVQTLIVRAQQSELMDFKSSPTWPALASIMPNGTDMPRPDRTHFHPFEDSADAARIIAEATAR